MLILIVAGGPDKGRIYELAEEQPVVLGREGDQIKLGDRKCSRKHARLWSEGGKWYARDLGSRHGTFLNAKPIDNKVELSDGDHLQIGSTLFVLARISPEAAERLALLGDVNGKGAATAPLPNSYPVSSGGRSKLAYAGAAMAAAVVIGSNALLYFNSLDQTQAIRSEIAAAKAAAQQGSREVIEQVQAKATPTIEPDPRLAQILAAVQAQGEQAQLLGQIKDAIAKLPDAGKVAEQVAAKLPKDDETRQLLEQVLVKLDAPADQAKLLQDAVARLEAQPNDSDTLKLILAKLEAQPAESEALKQVLARLEQQQPIDNDLLKSMIAKIDEQPQTQTLIAEVKAMAEAARKQQAALAAKSQETDELLREALAEVKSKPGAEAIAAAVREAGAGDDANAKLLQQVLANLEEQQALAKQIAEVRQLVEAQPEATRAAVREIVQALPTVPAEDADEAGDNEARVLEAIADLRATLPRDATAKLDQVLAKLDAQATPEQFAAAMKTVLDERAEPATPDQLAAAVKPLLDQQTPATPEQLATAVKAVLADQAAPATAEQLAAAVKTELDASAAAASAKFDALAAKLDAQPTKQELLAAIEKASTTEPDATVLAKLDEVAAQLKASAPSDQLASSQQATAKLLEEVLAEVRNRQPIEALRDELSKLAAAPGADTAEATKLDEILAAVKQDDGLNNRIAELHDLIATWPAETEAMLKQTLAAIGTSQQPQDPAVDEVLRDIKARALARFDELGEALRHDIQRELGSDQVAATPLPPQLTARDSVRRPAPTTGRAPVAPQAGPRTSVMAPQAAESQVVEADEPVLTATEQAYKVAFETGKQVTIGAGMMNAQTGEVSEGRTLDPTAARAAGIKHWREWYLMDDFAERMRLQKQQMRFRDDKGDQSSREYIALPPASPNTALAAPKGEADTAKADEAKKQ